MPGADDRDWDGGERLTEKSDARQRQERGDKSSWGEDQL
jgi:hypothetical protein